MATDNIEKIPSLPQTALRLINDAILGGSGYDNLISVLSLWCLLLILQRQSPAMSNVSTAGTTAANPLGKLLGELSKGDGGGPSPDTLMSLLPLLNSPQVKSKMNPANIASILSLVNSLGGSGGDKHDKAEKQEKAETRPEEKAETKKEPPAATVTTSANDSTASQEANTDNIADRDKKDAGRSLNWKNF